MDFFYPYPFEYELKAAVPFPGQPLFIGISELNCDVKQRTVVQGARRAARGLCRAAADRRAIKAKGFVAQVKLTNTYCSVAIDGRSRSPIACYPPPKSPSCEGDLDAIIVRGGLSHPFYIYLILNHSIETTYRSPSCFKDTSIVILFFAGIAS